MLATVVPPYALLARLLAGRGLACAEGRARKDWWRGMGGAVSLTACNHHGLHDGRE